jgi:Flp pilus assembly protein TadG
MRRLVRRRERSRGQSLVEFALVVPIFLFLVFALVDAARMMYAYNTISLSAREGARIASVQASYIGEDIGCTAVACPATAADLKANVTTGVNRFLIGMDAVPASSVRLSCTDFYLASSAADCAADNDQGNSVTVSVDYPFAPIAPLIAQILKPITITSSATMTIQ